MAKARSIVSDMHSQEFDELRRQFHNLLLVLENVADEVDAGNITADEAFTALKTTLENGTDADIATIDGGGNTYTGSKREVVGVKPTPTHPRRAKTSSLVTMDDDSDY